MSLDNGNYSSFDRHSKRKRVSHDSYTVAIIVPLAVELAPVRAVLDSFHDDLPTNRAYNSYILGDIGRHNVVVTTLPATGNNESSTVATQLLNDFPNVRFGILVGVGGGVPGLANIRLGDVVVSEGINSNGAVIQLDRGKRLGEDIFEWTGHLNNPHPVLAAAVKSLRAQHSQEHPRLSQIVSDMFRRYPNMRRQYEMPDTTTDRLFEATYKHQGTDCTACSSTKVVSRPVRKDWHPRIHYGPVGSSNAVIRSGTERDKLREQFKILSVEMEAAGLMNVLPCLVIRGICDYADSHKSKIWQPYAAATAAAYMKELLAVVPAVRLTTFPSANRGNADVPKLEAVSQFDDCLIIQELIKSLVFDGMDARLHNIEDAHPYTCRWLFQDDRYQIWMRRQGVKSNHGFFWIKGKPGSGKSTVMKSALERLGANQNDESLLSYFFNARAPGRLEKSSMGLYRSFVYQVLRAYPDAEQLFLKRFRSKVRVKQQAFNQVVGQALLGIEEWSEVELRNFISASIKVMENKPMNVFIDALDEGEESDVRRLVDFLENLALNAIEHDVQLRICLSSRHYPQIRIRKALSLVLEDHPGHRTDIEDYVNDKLDDIGGEDEHFQARICEKSAMVFLWVVLVIPVLRRAYDKGMVAEMLRCLEELPQDLETLFDEIISRDLVNIEQCYKLLHIVLFARRPLTQSELYIAIQFYETKPRWKLDELPSEVTLSRYIVDCSRGLVEETKSEPPTVQFVHELVRTYIERHTYRWPLGDQHVSWRAAGHNALKTICFEYFQHAMSDSRICLPTWQHSTFRHSSQFPYPRAGYGLDHYVLEHMLAHADQTSRYGSPQCEFLGSFVSFVETAPDQQQIELTLKLMGISYKGPSIVTDSLLLRLVGRNFSRLVADLIKILPDDAIANDDLVYAICYASARGYSQTLRVLVEAGPALGLDPLTYDSALSITPDMDAECVRILTKRSTTVDLG